MLEVQQAHDSAKENAEIRYHLGVALMKTGKEAEGRKLIEEAVAKGGAAPWVGEAKQALAQAR